MARTPSHKRCLDALRHVYNVLGPRIPTPKEKALQRHWRGWWEGLSYEASEALHTVREVLGIKLGDYPAPQPKPRRGRRGR